MSAQRIDEILGPLTSSQREAVQHVEGPLLILAGPGSGKTRVITHRIAHMLYQGVAARQILALTFTNKAAEEMQLRLEGLAPRQPVWMGTFHRFCSRLLRQYASMVGLTENFSIFDTQDSKRALKQTVEDAEIDLTHTSLDQIASTISWAKNEVVPSEDYAGRSGNVVGGLVERIYPEYQKHLLRSNAVDFDDLLLHVARLLRDNDELRHALDERFRYILVDEYQDTNLAQYTIARALSQDYPNLAVAGDPDQSIYGWRGANLDNILDFERNYPDVAVVRLEQNYRSTPNILRLADHLITFNVRRKPKSLFTDRPEGLPPRLVIHPTSKDEADQIAQQIARDVESGNRRFRDFAIFYRLNALSRGLEGALRSMNIPYVIIKGLEFYQRKEIKDILAYLHVLNNPSNDVALRRIINTPPRKIGKKTVQAVSNHALRYGLPMLDAVREAAMIESLSARAKSALAKFVAIYDELRDRATLSLTDIMKQVLQVTNYHEWLFNSDDPEDENRLDNIQELITAAEEFDEDHGGEGSLEEFLEQVSLVSDTDEWEADNDRVALMTLHAAKGLEFPVVFMTAVEKGLLPHERSSEEPDVEEERRLMFVGITRAEEELNLSCVKYRTFRGKRTMAAPSEFLNELPREDLQVIETESMYRPTFEHDTWADASFDDDDFVQHAPHEVMIDVDAPLSSQPFQRGMVVEHPEYGEGTILSIRGTGRNRSATVRFYDDGDEKTFRLSHAPLSLVTSVD